MLLQIVTLARDVGRDFDLVRKSDAGDLAEGRVRLLRGGRVDAHAHAALLRAALEGGRRRLDSHGLTALAHELVDRRHSKVFLGAGAAAALIAQGNRGIRLRRRSQTRTTPWSEPTRGSGERPSFGEADDYCRPPDCQDTFVVERGSNERPESVDWIGALVSASKDASRTRFFRSLRRTSEPNSFFRNGAGSERRWGQCRAWLTRPEGRRRAAMGGCGLALRPGRNGFGRR